MTDEERDAYMDEVQDPPMHYDRSGRPISLREWGELMQSRQPVMYTMVAHRWEVSTVWLGIDHNFGVGPPVIFETMVFDGGAPGMQRRHDLEQRRYSTEEQALLGHEEMVQLVMTLEETEDRIDVKP